MEITCEFIAKARSIDKATIAEMMVNSRHRVTKCEKCEKFHVWVEVSQLEWAGAASARNEAKTAFYIQMGPNAYLHKGYRAKKKVKAGKGANVDEEE